MPTKLLKTDTMSETLQFVWYLLFSTVLVANVDQSVMELLAIVAYPLAGRLSKLVEAHSTLNHHKVLTKTFYQGPHCGVRVSNQGTEAPVPGLTHVIGT